MPVSQSWTSAMRGAAVISVVGGRWPVVGGRWPEFASRDLPVDLAHASHRCFPRKLVCAREPKTAKVGTQPLVGEDTINAVCDGERVVRIDQHGGVAGHFRQGGNVQ